MKMERVWLPLCAAAHIRPHTGEPRRLALLPVNTCHQNPVAHVVMRGPVTVNHWGFLWTFSMLWAYRLTPGCLQRARKKEEGDACKAAGKPLSPYGIFRAHLPLGLSVFCFAHK